MAKAKRKKTSSRSPAPVIIRESAPRAAPTAIVVRQSSTPARRSSGRRQGGGAMVKRSGLSGMFAKIGGGARAQLVPIKEAAQGGGGGVLSGILDDVLPNSWSGGASDGGKRALLVMGAGTLLAWGAGMPATVVAGLAGGVGRKYYDDVTNIIKK